MFIWSLAVKPVHPLKACLPIVTRSDGNDTADIPVHSKKAPPAIP